MPSLAVPAVPAVPIIHGGHADASAAASRVLSARHLGAAALTAFTLGAMLFSGDVLTGPARVAITVFALAIIAWVLLRLEDAPVALAGAVAVVVLGAVPAKALYDSLGGSLMWLLVAAFILAAVLRRSGLAERWALQAVAACQTVQQLFWRLSFVIAATAFVIPSTAGRAALLLPVFLSLAAVIREPRVVRALALLFPSVILLSACASILGAGAHVVAAEFMQRTAPAGSAPISFAHWALLGAPFALLCSAAACALILRLFLDPSERGRAVTLPVCEEAALSREQRHTAAIVAAVVLLWVTSAWHGVEPAVVALLGALLATTRAITGSALKETLKQVDWNLLLFLAATLVMGEALLQSGAAQALAQGALKWVTIGTLGPWGAVVLAALLSVLSHLVITSRTARAVVLLPTIALPLAAAGVNPALLIFVTVVGSGFCQTLKVSAKPVALFAALDVPTYDDADLRRLSLWLMPMVGLALVLFALLVWPWLGLPLRRDGP